MAAIRGHVVEVLTYCVRAHGYRMRYFIILNNLAQKVRGFLFFFFS